MGRNQAASHNVVGRLRDLKCSLNRALLRREEQHKISQKCPSNSIADSTGPATRIPFRGYIARCIFLFSFTCHDGGLVKRSSNFRIILVAIKLLKMCSGRIHIALS